MSVDNNNAPCFTNFDLGKRITHGIQDFDETNGMMMKSCFIMIQM